MNESVLNLSESTDRDFNYIREVVYKLSRISLGPQKKTLVVSRVAKRLRALRCPDLKTYCELLRKPSGQQELSHLIDVISTNHTFFFRESPHFEYLTRKVLAGPRLNNHRPFRVWSAACSTGEEPYSIAMVLEEQRRFETGFDWAMEATDISSSALSRAQAGVYPANVLARVPQRLFRHLVAQPDGQSYEVGKALKQRIRFHQLNLFSLPSAFPGEFDLIVCRNVMIYFDASSRTDLTRSLVQRLRDGGTLFVGHSESLHGIDVPLERVQPAVYRKVGS